MHDFHAVPGLRYPAVPFLAFGGIAALTASAAATGSLLLGFAPWAMFIGWVAWFTRPVSLRQGFATWLSLLGGLALGALAVLSLRSLTPSFGVFALGLVVFVVALAVVSMRAVRLLDNIPAWFLGLIAYFAAHLEPAFASIAELGATAAIGIGGGWVSQTLQRRWVAAH
jgi:hypothetical protein